MSRNPALVLFTALALIVPASAFAQLTPPAGSAGAGNSSISGVPFGPANARALSDPSGIGNAASVPPLRPNPPAPVTSYGSVDTRGATRTARDAALYRRLAADHQRAPSSAAKTAGSAAGATGGEQFHGDLPGLLAINPALHPAGSEARKRTDISSSGHREEQFSLAGLMQG